MSMETITERIRREAEAYAEAQLTEAKASAEAILSAAREEAEAKTKSLRAEAEKEAATIKERRASVADLDSRKMKLAARQEVIGECFEAARKELRNLSPEESLRLVKAQLEPFREEGGEVLLSASDKEKFGEALAKELEGSALTLSEETREIEGGCIVKRGDIFYNASLERLLETAKNECTKEVAETLFR